MRVERVHPARGDQVVDLVVGLLTHPRVDRLTGGLRVRREVHRVRAGAVVAGQHVEEGRLEVQAGLGPDPIGGAEDDVVGAVQAREVTRARDERQLERVDRVVERGAGRRAEHIVHLCAGLAARAVAGHGQRQLDAVRREHQVAVPGGEAAIERSGQHIGAGDGNLGAPAGRGPRDLRAGLDDARPGGGRPAGRRNQCQHHHAGGDPPPIAALSHARSTSEEALRFRSDGTVTS